MLSKTELAFVMLAGVGVFFIASAFFTNQTGIDKIGNAYLSPQPNQQAANGLPEKCYAPEGQNQEAWEEHMGHHPDLYAECLQGGG